MLRPHVDADASVFTKWFGGLAVMFAGLTLDTFIRALAEALVECMADRDASLVSQRDRRGLGGRRHIEAVKRRVAEQVRSGGERDAFISANGRDYLLTPAAVRDELARATARVARNENAARPRTAKAKPKAKTAAAVERDELARLKRELEAEMRSARER